MTNSRKFIGTAVGGTLAAGHLNFGSVPGRSEDTPAKIAPPDITSLREQWAEDFSGPELDLTRWQKAPAFGGSDFQVENGRLSMRAPTTRPAGPEKADFVCSMALTSKGPQVCVYNNTAYVDLQARFKAFLLPEQKMITYHYALDWDRAAIKPLHQVRLGLVIRAKGGEMIELFSGIQNKGDKKDAGSFGVVALT